MFAVLGDIEFELITYWDGFEVTFGVDYAEHPRIEGKPGLQFVGDKLDEIQISLVFHQHYCVPDVELARLRTAMKAHQALALVFGNEGAGVSPALMSLVDTPVIIPMPGNAPPSFTQSSCPANGTGKIRSPICATCSPACRG